MDYAGGGLVDLGTAKVHGGNLFAGNGLHHARTRDEHLGGVFHHEDEVGNGRRIAGTACAGAKHHRNLGNEARGVGVALENFGIAVESVDAFFDTGSTAVIDANKRSAGLDRQIHGVANLLGMNGTEGSAVHGKILGTGIDQTAVDLAVAGHHAVSRKAFLFGQVGGFGLLESTNLYEGALVEQVFDALAGGHLALFVLTGYTGFAAGSVADSVTVFQFLDILLVPHVLFLLFKIWVRDSGLEVRDSKNVILEKSRIHLNL